MLLSCFEVHRYHLRRVLEKRGGYLDAEYEKSCIVDMRLEIVETIIEHFRRELGVRPCRLVYYEITEEGTPISKKHDISEADDIKKIMMELMQERGVDYILENTFTITFAYEGSRDAAEAMKKKLSYYNIEVTIWPIHELRRTGDVAISYYGPIEDMPVAYVEEKIVKQLFYKLSSREYELRDIGERCKLLNCEIFGLVKDDKTCVEDFKLRIYMGFSTPYMLMWDLMYRHPELDDLRSRFIVHFLLDALALEYADLEISDIDKSEAERWSKWNTGVTKFLDSIREHLRLESVLIDTSHSIEVYVRNLRDLDKLANFLDYVAQYIRSIFEVFYKNYVQQLAQLIRSTTDTQMKTLPK